MDSYVVENKVRQALLEAHQRGLTGGEMLEAISQANPYSVHQKRSFAEYNRLTHKQMALYAQSPAAWLKFCGLPEASQVVG